MYLLNYSVYKPPDSWKSSHKSFLDNSIACGVAWSHEHQLHHSSCHYFLHSTCLPTLASQGAILPAASCGRSMHES